MVSTNVTFASSSMQKSKARNAQIFALIAMGSFGMLFGTFLLSFLLAEQRNLNWPPIGVEPINKALAFMSTGLILASSFLYYFGESLLKSSKLKAARYSFLATFSAGIIFLSLQYFTLKGLWTQGQSLSSDIYSGSVHVLLGLHATHLFAGLLGLAFVLVTSFFRTQVANSTAVQIVGWFWHFLGLMWCLIFLVLVL